MAETKRPPHDAHAVDRPGQRWIRFEKTYDDRDHKEIEKAAAEQEHLVTREDARIRLSRVLPYWVLPQQDWRLLRNYELEDYLFKCFGGDWVIVETCPFNGIYCAGGRYLGLWID